MLANSLTRYLSIDGSSFLFIFFFVSPIDMTCCCFCYIQRGRRVEERLRQNHSLVLGDLRVSTTYCWQNPSLNAHRHLSNDECVRVSVSVYMYVSVRHTHPHPHTHIHIQTYTLILCTNMHLSLNKLYIIDISVLFDVIFTYAKISSFF